jgi:hypothetical protein
LTTDLPNNQGPAGEGHAAPSVPGPAAASPAPERPGHRGSIEEPAPKEVVAGPVDAPTLGTAGEPDTSQSIPFGGQRLPSLHVAARFEVRDLREWEPDDAIEFMLPRIEWPDSRLVCLSVPLPGLARAAVLALVGEGSGQIIDCRHLRDADSGGQGIRQTLEAHADELNSQATIVISTLGSKVFNLPASEKLWHDAATLLPEKWQRVVVLTTEQPDDHTIIPNQMLVTLRSQDWVTVVLSALGIDANPIEVVNALQIVRTDILNALRDGDPEAVQNHVTASSGESRSRIEKDAKDLFRKQVVNAKEPAYWGAVLACAGFPGLSGRTFDVLSEAFSRTPGLVKPMQDQNGLATPQEVRATPSIRNELEIVSCGARGSRRVEFKRGRKFTATLERMLFEGHGTECALMFETATCAAVYENLNPSEIVRFGRRLTESIYDREDGDHMAAMRSIVRMVIDATCTSRYHVDQQEQVDAAVRLLICAGGRLAELGADRIRIGEVIISALGASIGNAEAPENRHRLALMFGGFVAEYLAQLESGDKLQDIVTALSAAPPLARLFALASLGMEEFGQPPGPSALLEAPRLDTLIAQVASEMDGLNDLQRSMRASILWRLVALRLQSLLDRGSGVLMSEAAVAGLIRVLGSETDWPWLNQHQALMFQLDEADWHMLARRLSYSGNAEGLRAFISFAEQNSRGILALVSALGLNATQRDVELAVNSIWHALFRKDPREPWRVLEGLAVAGPALAVAWLTAPHLPEIAEDEDLPAPTLTLPDISSLLTDRAAWGRLKAILDVGKDVLLALREAHQSSRAEMRDLKSNKGARDQATYRREALAVLRDRLSEMRD